MASKRIAGIAKKSFKKQTTVKSAVITSVQSVLNVVATYPKEKRESLIRHLRPLVLSYLKRQKTEWGYLAVSSKELCRGLNGQTLRGFCHQVNTKEALTSSSYSAKRGCSNVAYPDIPCKIKYLRVRACCLALAKEGFINTWKGRALDLKDFGHYRAISTDLYRFWQFREGGNNDRVKS